MSTTHDRDQPVQQRNQNDQNTILPTFTSIHDQIPRQSSYAESSNASSSRSHARRSQTRSDHGSEPRGSPSGRDEVVDRNGRPRNVNGTIRRMKRASAGFLLDSSPASSALSRSILTRKDAKGKKNLDNSTLTVPQRGVQVDGQAAEPARRSSPLSSEIKSTFQAIDFSAHPAQSPDRRYGRQNGASLPSHDSSSFRQNVSEFGFDTDPVQIVEMALRLNEGRQRQASEKRYISSASHARRIVSTATSAPPRSSTPPSAERSDRVARQRSNRKSLNVDSTTPVKAASNLPPADIMSPVLSERLSPEQDVDGEKEEMRISRATQNRVEKAKIYFEIAYEHRRLLSHLPPLRRPGTQGLESKLYNPLQYARNRKLRFRERAPINSELEGWHDIEKVRAWVDAVVSSHAETRHDPLECVRLPPLSLQEKSAEESDNEADAAERKNIQPGKPRRPKSDWVTHPGDLIADAFWTEQGLNKQKIYDRDNVPIFPPGTRFHFSGWRNRTPISVPDRYKDSFTSPETSPTNVTKVVTTPLDLPTFESAHKDHSWAKRKSKFSKALSKDTKGTKKKDRDIFDTSSSESDTISGDEKDEKDARGRKRLSKRQEKMPLSEGDPFAAPVESASKADIRRESTDIDASGRSKRGSLEHGSLLKYLQRNTASAIDFNDENEKHKLGKRRKFLHSISLEPEHEVGRSSLEYDSTAPGTPVAHGFPSIAINLSPPESREPSPSRKGKSSFLGAVKDKMHVSKDRVDRTDFAEHGSGRGSRDHSAAPHLKRLSHDWSRGPSPMGRGPSPFARQRTTLSVDESAYPESEPRENMLTKISSKTTDSLPHRSHRVRGMFKGGRIAELVGNEVSRVGDYIWKRDRSDRRNAAEGSNSGYESDSDDMTDPKDRSNGTPNRERKVSPSRSVSTTKSITPASAVSKSSPRDVPQFHIQGLPSFTSPFQRDREAQEKKKMPQSPGGTAQEAQEKEYDSDPVSTAAAARRSAGKSPRLDRLAPPKLDIKAATPDARRNSYGFGASLDLARTRSASQLYNSAINGQSSERRPGSHKSGSAAFIRPYTLSPHNLSRTTTTQTTNQIGINKRITLHDFIRARALLLSAAIKATNISAYCDEIPSPQSSFLFSAFQSTGASGAEINEQLPVSRKEEHTVAARHLVEHLTLQSQTFNEHLNGFTRSTTLDLHREIQILEDMTESTLFPRLGRLSDQAGQLAQKLTTTSTLAVKGVNDEVIEAIRMKRRGPYRWGRLLGYKLIEIGVVGLLWIVWFVVTSIRFVVAIFRGFWTVVAWLLFLR